MQFILSLDQGTTSSRAIAFNHAGAVVASAQREFTQIFPQPGWVEHNASEIWTTQLAVAREVIAALPAQAKLIENKGNVTVVWSECAI